MRLNVNMDNSATECIVCKSVKVEFANKKINEWRFYKCQSCGLLFTDTKKKKPLKINAENYDQEYVKNYLLRQTELVNRFGVALKIVEKYCGGGRILDIGCSIGFFLQAVDKYATKTWQSFGIDLNEKLIAEAKKHTSANVKKGSLSKIPFVNAYFDCVTCFDVLEHSAKLETNLNEILRVLKPGGVLVIQVPNNKSLMAFLTGNKWDWWYPPDHVLHFSLETLNNYLTKANYTVEFSYTYDTFEDFFKNNFGIKKGKLRKLIFISILPILIVVRYFCNKLGFGGLLFVIARKTGHD